MARLAREMEEERRRLDERKRLADLSSQRRAQFSAINSSTGRTPQRRKSRLDGIPEADRAHMTRNLESSFMTFDTSGNVIPKTPAAAALAVATYLRLTQPPEGDPRAEQHRQAILGMGMIGARLGPLHAQPPPENTAAAETRGAGTSRQNRDLNPRGEASQREHRSRERNPSGDRDFDARNQITQSRMDKARSSRRNRSPSSSDGDEDLYGSQCFS